MGDLPSEFDVVVAGTGLVESIVSAACARNGHTVLQVDPREYYSGKWATLSWDQWTSGAFGAKERPICDSSTETSDLTWRNNVRDLEQVWYDETNEELQSEIQRKNRQFNIDIFPKVLMAREELIQLLIQSNVARYLEFKSVSKIMCNLPPPENNRLEVIPLTKSDIFTSKALSLIEKRNLMKFIEEIVKSSPSTSSPTTSSTSSPQNFEEFAEKHNLSQKGRHFVSAALKLSDYQSDFVDHTRLFLESVGRYGNLTPYLWTLYGISEICQSFCRLAAIYGTIFILKRFIEKVEESPSEIIIKTGEDTVKAKFLVLGPEISHKNLNSHQTHSIARAVLLTRGRALKHEEIDVKKGETLTKRGIVLYSIDDMEVIELDASSQAFPELPGSDIRLVHISMKVEPQPPLSVRNIIESKLETFLNFSPPPSSPRPSNTEDMDPATDSDNERVAPSTSGDQMTDSTKPQVIYGSYFLLDFYEPTPEKVENQRIFHCSTPSSEICTAISRAQSIFSQLYPLEEFLPRAPDAHEQSNNNEDENANEMEDLVQPQAAGDEAQPAQGPDLLGGEIEPEEEGKEINIESSSATDDVEPTNP